MVLLIVVVENLSPSFVPETKVVVVDRPSDVPDCRLPVGFNGPRLRRIICIQYESVYIERNPLRQ